LVLRGGKNVREAVGGEGTKETVKSGGESKNVVWPEKGPENGNRETWKSRRQDKYSGKKRKV